ncbi:hypothetical protein ACVWW1_008026 [Bradyrhizobium sp. JR3.5]
MKCPATQPGIAGTPAPVNAPVPDTGPASAWARVATSATVRPEPGAPAISIRPSRMTRSSGAASIISEATFKSFVRTSCAADRLAAPSETVVRPPPTPTS